MRYLFVAIAVIFVSSLGLGQSIQLNEIVSSNGDNLYDEDGDTPDWIEIYNPSDESINLLGFGITDDVNDLLKWTFPLVELAPSEFLVVFASSKDRKSRWYNGMRRSIGEMHGGIGLVTVNPFPIGNYHRQT